MAVSGKNVIRACWYVAVCTVAGMALAVFLSLSSLGLLWLWHALPLPPVL
jgi:hypothetical protein